MTLIVITLPHFFEGEANALNRLFRAGLDILHLRKPGASVGQVRQLLDCILPEYRTRIVTHEHFMLAQEYGLRGIHLNGRNPDVPAGYSGHVSCSCHSLSEVVERKPMCRYVFLSPIYNSISKQGYASAFTPDALTEAARQGIVDHRVMALGGIGLDNLPEVKRAGFGGAAVLGDLWQWPQNEWVPHLLQLKRACGEPAVVLSVAGSDSSAGAGIQADLKTVSALGGYAATVITAVTAQNTQGVQEVLPMSPAIVSAQLISVLNDLCPQGVKTGMLPNETIIHTLADALEAYRPLYSVCDPVMIATSGRRLMDADAADALQKRLFPLCTLITPNLHEAAYLYGCTLSNPEDMKKAAEALAHRYGTSVLLKGGHLTGDVMTDVAYNYPLRSLHLFSGPKIASGNLHGTGCTLSSAITTLLCQGHSLQQAIARAKEYMTRAIERGARLHIGQGNGPLGHFMQ